MNSLSEAHTKTLVVGTTPDYIDWIRKIEPGKNIFLTDPVLRQKASEAPPRQEEEILCNLSDYQQTCAGLQRHLDERGCKLDGITSFDCESMELTAFLAKRYDLSYPSAAAIRLCRNKYLSKLRWQESGLDCPASKLISSSGDAERFQKQMAAPIILKPLTGSGSEHVYKCGSTDECRKNFETIIAALAGKQTNRLYRSVASASALIVAEEYIEGDEYSCDFMIDGGQIRMIRLTKKIRAEGKPFGTIHGYVLCNHLPEQIGQDAFMETLRTSARSLQINRGICMLDFIVQNGKAVLLEMAPRPGGDCLPYLLKRARRLDILQFCLEFARHQSVTPANSIAPDMEYLGVRIIAGQEGILRTIDISTLQKDKRVLEIGLAKQPGHVIMLPPADYDSWILGYVVAVLTPGCDSRDQLIDIDRKINIVTDAL